MKTIVIFEIVVFEIANNFIGGIQFQACPLAKKKSGNPTSTAEHSQVALITHKSLKTF